MTSAHHFIDISQNILNIWMRLFFPETRHLGFNLSTRMRQFRSELWQIWFFKISCIGYYSSYGKTEFWLAPHSHKYFHLMHQISPKTKMRSRFMILCQPSLNDLPFIFSPPLLYKPPISFIQRHTKPPLSSPLLSSSEIE